MPLFAFPRRPLVPTSGTPIITPDNPLWVGLVNFWMCNEGGGSVLHDLFGNQAGSISGTTSWTQSPFGPAVVLGGSPTFIQMVVPSSNTQSKNISLTCRLYWIASTESYNSVFSDETGGGAYTFLLKSSQQPAFYNSGAGSDPITSTTIPFNQWLHLGLTWINASTVTVYVNGTSIGSASLGNSGGDAGNIAMRVGGGSPFGSGRYINGYMREIGMWNRALNASEMLSLAQIPAYPISPHRIIQASLSGPVVNTYYTLKQRRTKYIIESREDIDGADIYSSI